MTQKLTIVPFLGALICLLLSFQVTVAQDTPFDCYSESHNRFAQKSSRSSGPGCFDDISVEEINEMPIVTLTVDFHFVSSNGNNFQCSDPNAPYYAPTYVDQILGYANFLATNPAQNEFGTSPDLDDTRIRYRLAGDPANPCENIFFYETTPFSFANPDAFHIVVVDNGLENIGGWTDGSSFMALANVHYHIFEQGWQNAEVWGNVVHHEFGHVFGLCHAFSALNDIGDMNPSQECGGPESTMCGDDPCPVIDPGTPHPSCGTNECYRCYCTWGTGNNFMGYTLPQIGMTRLQWARMYGSIYDSQPNFVSIERSCEVTSNDPLVIPEGQFVEWNSLRILTRPLIIETGATLVIKCEVRVSEELSILVKRGARLIVEGGKITSGTPDCLWGGIYVLGNSGMAQPSVADAQNYFGTIPTTGAGAVWINGGIIENAVCGIHTKGFGGSDSQTNFGGLVMVNSSDFINNGRAVEFMKYDFSNNSYLKDVDVKYVGSPSWPVTKGVSIWACSDIKFEDVRFEGIAEYGIYGINFTAEVKQCTFKNRTSNPVVLRYGFRSENTGPNIHPNSSTLIDDCDFEQHKFDVYCNSTPNNIYPLRIEHSRFKDKPTSGLFGIRIGGDAFYTIGSGNEFNDKYFAVYLTNTGALANRVDCNFFGELETVTTGVLAHGSNSGLEISGNEFLQNTNNEITLATNSSIHETQGKITGDANNCFANPTSAIKVPASSALFRYYVFDLANAAFCEKPTNNLNDGGTNNYRMHNATIKKEDCNYDGPNVTPNDLGPARQNTQIKKALWLMDLQNDQKYVNYLTAKDWQAYVLRKVLQQAVSAGNLDAAESYLMGENTNQARREVVGIRLSRGNISGAQALVNSMTVENEEDIRFRQIMNINFAIEQSPDPTAYELTASQNDQLQAIANNPASIMRGYACALLSFCTGSVCEDEIPEAAHLADQRAEEIPKEMIHEVKVFPNPNAGQWTIKCPMLLEKEISCQILSVDGKTIKTHRFVNTGSVQILEDTLPDGIYLIKLSHENETLYQGRIVILR
ncbi:MAG: T9SS type A sorting domain-containing protein [Saprospiraceae bacterium]|nr:T9SS type A sorting domain-containing protein [Saprospiraceae bacterium]